MVLLDKFQFFELVSCTFSGIKKRPMGFTRGPLFCFFRMRSRVVTSGRFTVWKFPL